MQFVQTTPSGRPQHKGSMTIAVSGIGTNIEYMWGNTFRIGKVIIDIDQTQLVELQDERGRKCRISGPAGPSNLEDYILRVREDMF